MPQLLLYDNQRRLWPAGLVCTTSTSNGIVTNKDSSINHPSSLVVVGGGGGGSGKIMGPCLKRGLGEANSLFELQLSNNQYDDILDMEDDDGLNAIMMSNGGASGMGGNGVMGGCGSGNKKAKRLSGEQVKALETAFDADNKLEAERKVQLAGEVGLQPRQVAIWFQNRRARWKTKQMEIDYSTLKAKYDALLADRDHLLKQKDSLQHQVALLKNRIPGSDSLSEPAGVQATKTEGEEEEEGGGGGRNDNESQDYDDANNNNNNNNNINKNNNCIKEVDFDININNNDNSSYYNNKEEEVNNCSTSNGANEDYDDVDDDVSEESSGIVNGDSPSSQFQLPAGRYSRAAATNNASCQGQRKTVTTSSFPLPPLLTPVSTFTGTQFRSLKAAAGPYEDTGDPFALLNW